MMICYLEFPSFCILSHCKFLCIYVQYSTVYNSSGLMNKLDTAVFSSTLVQYKPVLCCSSQCVMVVFIEMISTHDETQLL